MKHLTTYLTFDGNCREAMTFYAACLGCELMLSPMSDAPGAPPSDRIMHSRLIKDHAVLMASDTMPGMTLTPSSNFSIAIECDSEAETETLFTALSAGGTVTMPLADTFWNARFGMLVDKFGIRWMVNFEKPKSS